jgi:hypothetical protein
MWRGQRFKALGLLAAGLLLGLMIGGAMGVLFSKRSPKLAASAGLKDLQLKAMASHGTDTFAIATGPIDDNIEGLFTLDFLTGDLQCFVINPRNMSVGGIFRSNVANHLGVERGKKPNYLMTTGTLNVSGGARMAASICYVVDANTGAVAAFGFPWAKAMTTAGAPQAAEMTVLGKWKARSVELRQ